MSTHESMTPLSPERLDEIRGRVEAADPGPWYHEPIREAVELTTVYRCFHNGDTMDRDLVAESTDTNVALIAHAPEDITDLLAEVQRLKRFESIVSWRYGDTTDGKTREDMVERAARAMWAPGERAEMEWADAREYTRQCYRADARVALDAALGTQEGA